MHAFMLIIAILGQPERATAICNTYHACDEQGRHAQERYVEQFHRQPKDFSYRVVPVVIEAQSDGGDT